MNRQSYREVPWNEGSTAHAQCSAPKSPTISVYVFLVAMSGPMTCICAQEGAGFDMPFHGGGLMMPGGPMMPPDFMAMAMGGRGGNPMAPHRPRPPPGPPPPDSALSDKLASPERDGESVRSQASRL